MDLEPKNLVEYSLPGMGFKIMFQLPSGVRSSTIDLSYQMLILETLEIKVSCFGAQHPCREAACSAFATSSSLSDRASQVTFLYPICKEGYKSDCSVFASLTDKRWEFLKPKNEV